MDLHGWLAARNNQIFQVHWQVLYVFQKHFSAIGKSVSSLLVSRRTHNAIGIAFRTEEQSRICFVVRKGSIQKSRTANFNDIQDRFGS